MRPNKRKKIIIIALFLVLFIQAFAYVNILVSEKYETQWITKEKKLQKEISHRAAQLSRQKRQTIAIFAVTALLLYYFLNQVLNQTKEVEKAVKI